MGRRWWLALSSWATCGLRRARKRRWSSRELSECCGDGVGTRGPSAAGNPRRDSHPGVCAMCARHVEESAPAKKWLEGKSFTDPAHLRARSDRVCEGCAWAVTGKGMDQVRMW